MNDEVRYLDILAIFHLVVGVIAGLFSCFPLINLSVGLSMLSEIPKTIARGELFSPFAMFPILFVALPAIIVIFGWMFAIAVILNAYYLKKRKWLTYCLVVGGIETVFMPFGTVLGVFTIIVLTKPNMKELFTQ